MIDYHHQFQSTDKRPIRLLEVSKGGRVSGCAVITQSLDHCASNKVYLVVTATRRSLSNLPNTAQL